MHKSNLRNQVRQTPLPKWKPWLPLYEAVMNSFQAIRDAKKPPGAGNILIEIERERALLDMNDEPILSFKITDNGIGMDDFNFDSFNTSYSDYREDEGGKGLGRFLWLKAFVQAAVDTTFIASESGIPHRRQFVFDEHYDPDKGVGKPAPGRPTGTAIHLIGLKEPYKSETARTTDQIVQRLVEHFLLIFFREECPTVTVHDYGLRQSVNTVFEKDYRTSASEHEFKIEDVLFTLHGFRLTTPRVSKHKLVYAANQRGVVSETLVDQSYDIAQREDHVAVKFGRHPNDFMTSFYMRTPSEFLIEHGWGSRDVSPGWQPAELKSVGSFWGHQGLFESLGEGRPPPDAPPMPAPEPNHAPLQVIDGNYERMSGVCPWWETVKRNGRSVSV